jgi:hypothetical protein
MSITFAGDASSYQTPPGRKEAARSDSAGFWPSKLADVASRTRCVLFQRACDPSRPKSRNQSDPGVPQSGVGPDQGWPLGSRVSRSSFASSPFSACHRRTDQSLPFERTVYDTCIDVKLRG